MLSLDLFSGTPVNCTFNVCMNSVLHTQVWLAHSSKPFGCSTEVPFYPSS